MENNVLLVDIFNAWEEFAGKVKTFHMNMRGNPETEGQFKACMSIVRRDINELLAEVDE